MNESTLPTKEQIGRRAYDLYLERGAGHGRDLDDWFAAEKELTEMSEQPASTAPKAFAVSARTSAREKAPGDIARKTESRIPKVGFSN
jgi:hypothetical protein